jgi:hypothetical protein
LREDHFFPRHSLPAAQDLSHCHLLGAWSRTPLAVP